MIRDLKFNKCDSIFLYYGTKGRKSARWWVGAEREQTGAETGAEKGLKESKQGLKVSKQGLKRVENVHKDSNHHILRANEIHCRPNLQLRLMCRWANLPELINFED